MSNFALILTRMIELSENRNGNKIKDYEKVINENNEHFEMIFQYNDLISEQKID